MADLERVKRAYEATTSAQEYELQGLSIGCVSERQERALPRVEVAEWESLTRTCSVWRSWQHERLHLYVDADSERFLYVAHLHETPNMFEKKGVLWKKVFGRDPASPFRDQGGRVAYRVIAFEVPWRDVTGMDYTNPLCFDGRLVFECVRLVKREFQNLEQFHQYYGLNQTIHGKEGRRDMNDRIGFRTPEREVREDRDEWQNLPPVQCRPERETSPALAVHEQVYYSKTIAVTFDSPFLPIGLKKVVQNDARLLRFCESGIPAWAIFLPLYGLYYRPWMRTTAKILFMAVSTVSMVLGFYDLYKNIPGLRNALSVYIKPLTDWLELHASLRLSMLLTYLAAKSHLFQWFFLKLSAVTRVLQPLVRYILAPFQGVGRVAFRVLRDGLSFFVFWLQHLGSFLGAVLNPIFNLLYASVTLVVTIFGGIIGPVLRVCRALVAIPLFWLGDLWAVVAQVLQILLANIQGVLLSTAQASRSILSVVHTFKRPVTATSAVMPSSTHWNLLKEPSMKVMNAFRSILNFLVHIAMVLNKHRLTLGIIIAEKLGSFRERKSLAITNTNTALNSLAETAGKAMQGLSPTSKNGKRNVAFQENFPSTAEEGKKEK